MSEPTSPQSPDAADSSARDGWDRTMRVTRAQFWLRLLGVYFVIHGGSTLVSSIIRVLWIAKIVGWDSKAASVELVPCASWAIQLIIGLYLVTGGEWVIKTVFIPAPRDDPEGQGQEDPRT